MSVRLMQGRENILHEKTMNFAIRIVKMYQFLGEKKKEYIMSKHLLRSGTSIGALVRESQHGESTADFVHKLSIALKEANETAYWIELLLRSAYIDMEMFASINDDCQEIVSLLVKIIKSTKEKMK